MEELTANKTITDFEKISDVFERIDVICDYCNLHRTIYPEGSMELALYTKKLSLINRYEKGYALSLLQTAFQHWHYSEISEGLNQVIECCTILEKIKAYDHIGNANMVRGMIIWGKGEYDRAFTLIFAALNILDQENNILGKGYLFWCLGVFYYDLKDYEKSFNNYSKALEYYEKEEKKDPGFKSYILIGLGSVQRAKGNYDEALKLFIQSKEIIHNSGRWLEEARTHYEIGIIHLIKKRLDEAEVALTKSYTMRKEHHTKPGMVSCLISLSEIKIIKGELDLALKMLMKALQYSKETNTLPKIYQCHKKLSDLFKKQEKFHEAFDHLEKYYQIKSKVAGEEANNLLKDLETKHATEKSEKEKEIHRLINVDLKQKNKEILDSIKYAKRIQNAILPPFRLVKEYFKESFILYKPKDIVAGDFYWMEDKNDTILFAAADCTGHGVPGAMVSVVCHNAMNRAVKEYQLTEPGEILDKVRSIVIEEFEKSDDDVKDGMDIALCSLKGNQLKYSGAHNPLWIIRNGEILETKANKEPIGKFHHQTPFTTHSFELEKEDTIYIFSDGFVDQFGGEKEKKFKPTNLRKLLLEVQNQPLSEQKLSIDKAFEDWKGELEQVDDVCMIGVRVG